MAAKLSNLWPAAEAEGSDPLFYRETGEYKTTYAADMAIFPIRQDRYGVALILIVAFLVIPAFGNQFFLNTAHDDPTPFSSSRWARVGLNLLTRIYRPLVHSERALSWASAPIAC